MAGTRRQDRIFGRIDFASFAITCSAGRHSARTNNQVVALKFFQPNACEDDDWRSHGTVEQVSETQGADHVALWNGSLRNLMQTLKTPKPPNPN